MNGLDLLFLLAALAGLIGLCWALDRHEASLDQHDDGEAVYDHQEQEAA